MKPVARAAPSACQGITLVRQPPFVIRLVPGLEGWTPAFIVSLLRTRLQALRVSAGLRETAGR